MEIIALSVLVSIFGWILILVGSLVRLFFLPLEVLFHLLAGLGSWSSRE